MNLACLMKELILKAFDILMPLLFFLINYKTIIYYFFFYYLIVLING